jgi:hypothetical protein
MSESSGVKYPEIEVQLTGTDGNAFAILGKVARAMRDAGLTNEQVKEFQSEAMSGDYDHLLRTAMRFVEVS